MLNPVSNVWTELNPHKKAMCQHCYKQLKQGETIVNIVRLGRFTRTSKYHLECAEPILPTIMDELKELMTQLVNVSQKIEAHKATPNCNVKTKEIV